MTFSQGNQGGDDNFAHAKYMSENQKSWTINRRSKRNYPGNNSVREEMQHFTLHIDIDDIQPGGISVSGND